METHVCEDVHTEFILSSCYGFHQAVSMLDTESIQRLLRRTLCDTHWLHHWSWTGSRGLQFMFIPSGFPSDTEKRHRISRQLSRTVNHCSYVPHRERISNSSSSESKNRSNLSESEKSAKWASTHKRKILKSIFVNRIFWIFLAENMQFIYQE